MSSWYKKSQKQQIIDHPIKIIQLPERRQGTNYSCGAAAIQSVLAYYGIDIRESELKEALNTNPETGTDEQDIVNLAKKFGFHSFMKSLSIRKVIEYIEQDIPVILLIQAWADEPTDYSKTRNFPHFVVAVGYSSKGLYFEDPSLIFNGFLSFQELESRWRGSDSDHLGIVIFGKKPEYNENKAEHIE